MPRSRTPKAPPPEDMVAPPAAPPSKTRKPKATAPAPVVAPEVVELQGIIPPPPPPTLRKKVLVERVARATGAKPKLVKDVVDATLAALGDALSMGEDLHLPPLGRARVSRTRGDNASMLIVKLRRGGGKGKGGKEGLAELHEAD